MRFLDQFGKVASQAADAAAQAMERARFEAEKFHKTSRIQAELDDCKRQLDAKLIELGQRTYELYRTGHISPASVADLAHAVDQLRIDVTRKEDELRIAHAHVYVEPVTTATPPAGSAQSVPIQDESAASATATAGQQAPPPAQPAAPAAAPGKKKCPSCGFEMPAHAVFCPNCGFRLGAP